MNAAVTSAVATAFDRNRGLGASEAAAACGLSAFRTPLDLFLLKKGRHPEAANEDWNDDETLRLEMGLALEPVSLARFERRTGLRVYDRQRQFVDPKFPRRWVTVDAMSSDGGYVEAKSAACVSKEWGHDEFEENAVPMDYYVQTQHGMACSGTSHAWVPLIVLNRKFRLYVVKRDDELIEMMTAAERRFIQLLDDDVAPPPSNLHDCTILWPRHRDKSSIAATPEVLAASREHKELKKKIKELDEQREKLEVVIKGHMQDNVDLYTMEAGKRVLLNTWATARDSTYLDLDGFGIQYPKLYRGILDRFTKSKPGSRRLLSKEK